VLKPVDDEELKEAVSKAITSIEQSQQLENNTKLIEILTETISNKNKIIVPTEKGLSFIPQDEVQHLEGYDGYTKFHLSNKTELLSSYNLGKFEPSLGRIFFKCHKSHIVNLERVRSFENEGYLLLENGNRVPISKANKRTFLELFK
jgi:two-component system LytT family response regulator